MSLAVERDHLLALLLTPGIGHQLAARCIERFGSAEAAVAAGGSQWAQVPGISAAKASHLKRQAQRVLDEGLVEQEKQLIQRHGVRLIAFEDPDYPRLLRFIPDPPRLLWVRGTITDADSISLAIVGSRRASHYGREQAERFAALAADAGLTIVSGGAYGIDAAAHRGALKVKGRTLAVIGSGLADPYPADHRELFDQIAGGGGEPSGGGGAKPQACWGGETCEDHTSGGGGSGGSGGSGGVISELPMGTPPLPRQFPARNRIISGLSLGVLVIEAASRSGALITARLCVEEHGRECMALPGRVDSPASEGCHQLIRQGAATLVTNFADVLDCLGDAGQVLKASVTTPTGQSAAAPGLFEPPANEAQQRILAAAAQPATLDQLVAWSGLTIEQVQSEMTMLEIRGQVRRTGGLFARKSV